MSGIVKHTQLREVSEALWNKVKDREVTGGTFTKDTKTLELTKTSGNVSIDMDGIVTRWKDLEHVSENEHINVLDNSKTEEGKALANTTGDIVKSTGWGIIEFKAIPDQTYTILRQRGGWYKVRFEKSDGSVLLDTKQLTVIKNHNRATFTVPQDVVKAYYEVQLTHQHVKTEMILKGDHTQTDIPNYISYADEKLIHVSDVSLSFDNSDTNIKASTIEGAIKELDKSSITVWGDLEHVAEYPHANLMDYNKKVTGGYYGGNQDTWIDDSNWSTYFIDVKPNEQYAIYRRDNDNQRVVYTDSIRGTRLEASTMNTINQIGGFHGGSITVPNRPNLSISKMAVQFQHDRNGINDIMILKGTLDTTNNITEFIPYIDGNATQIGKEVSYEFDNTGTNIQATTVSGAIKELSASRDNFITDWEDLDHVQKYPYANLIDYGNKITGYWYGNNGGEHHVPNTYWSIYELPVKPNGTYTIFRKNPTLDSSRYELFNDDTHIETRQVQNVTHDGWQKQVIQVPHNVNKVGMCFQHNINGEDSLMAIEGDLSNVSVNFIPYIDGQLLQIGNELSLKFDNTGTNINSKTISSAIKELSNRSIGSVTSWGDLKYTEEHPYVNILDYSKRLDGKWYGSSVDGTQSSNVSWSIYELPVVEGQTYTISRRRDDNHRYYYFEDDTFVSYENVSYAGHNGWLCDVVTIPTGRNINKMGLQFQHGMNPQNALMVFEGRSLPTSDKFTPFLNGVHVIIGTEVIHRFDNAGTNLNSTYVHDAIKELNGKIANTGSGTVTRVNGVTPDSQGHVTVELQHIPTVQTALNLKMNTTDADNKFIPKTDAIDASIGQADTGKVVKLNSNGQISASMIPAIAITSVKKYNLQQDALNAANRGDIHIGDVVVLTGDGNRVYMYADTSGNSFQDKFIELHLGAGTIRTIGGQIPNGVGDIELLFRYGTDAWELNANGTKITSIETMTAAEKQGIINLFV